MVLLDKQIVVARGAAILYTPGFTPLERQELIEKLGGSLGMFPQSYERGFILYMTEVRLANDIETAPQQHTKIQSQQ